MHLALGAKIVLLLGGKCPCGTLPSSKNTKAGALRWTVRRHAHGVFQAEGPNASVFLDLSAPMTFLSLALGESLYPHFLDPQANVIDDLLIYRRAPETYLVVVNAAKRS